MLNTNINDYRVQIIKSLREKDVSVEEIQVLKVNEQLTGLKVHFIGDSEKEAPVVYAEPYFENGISVEDATKNILCQLNAIKKEDTSSNLRRVNNLTKEDVLRRTIPQLISKKDNEAMLKDIPHKEFLDMTIIYRCILDKGDRGVSSFIVSNTFASHYKITEEELEERSIINNLPTISSIGEMLRRLMPKEVEVNREMIAEAEMYILTNRTALYGASVIINTDFLKSTFKELGIEEGYILPSSIHETLLLPIKATNVGEDYLQKTIEDINEEFVSPSERLSNSLYYCKYENGEVQVSII